MKTCSRCQEDKNPDEFYKHRQRKDGLYSWCKECAAKDNRTRYSKRKDSEAQREYSRRYSLKRHYGLTLEQYNVLLEKQEHRCVLCGKHQDECKQNLSVDHNHQTGEIRGLACTFCNHRIIGNHKDPGLLRKLADYIESGTGLFVPGEFIKGPKRRRKRKKKNG